MSGEVHAFVAPEVIELHLERQQALPAGTAKLLWAINHLGMSDEPLAKVIPLRPDYPDIVA